MKYFVALQALFLLGHIYAFATQLLPYYLQQYHVVEGDVMCFSEPASSYNRAESFCVNGVCFHYNYFDISFGYHDTVFDNGVISKNTKNVRITYVYNPLTGENIIMKIEQM